MSLFLTALVGGLAAGGAFILAAFLVDYFSDKEEEIRDIPEEDSSEFLKLKDVVDDGTWVGTVSNIEEQEDDEK